MPVRDKKTTHYSFIFPAHNEAAIIESQIMDFGRFIRQRTTLPFEILVVENGSTDKTWRKILTLAKKLPQLRGLRIIGASYGRAIKHGFLSCRGERVILLNVDFFDKKFIDYCLRNNSRKVMIVGSKTHSLSKDDRGLMRQQFTRLHSFILSTIFRYPGKDTHGIKMFCRTPLFLQTVRECAAKHELFDTELLVRLSRADVKLIEYPVAVKEIRKTRYQLSKRMVFFLTDLWRIITFSFFSKTKFDSKIQICADDYGLSSTVNKAILDQLAAGNIHKISILANLTGASELRDIRRHKNSDLALHFNLLRGRPVAECFLVPSLVNKAGEFYTLPIFFCKLFFKQISLQDVGKEITYQLLKLKKQGVTVRFIDSEQHLHVFPPLHQLVVKLAEQYNLKIRHQDSTEQYLQHFPVKYVVYKVLMSVLSMRYGQIKKKKTPGLYYQARISHPGSGYD